jgi:hypothetical protein
LRDALSKTLRRTAFFSETHSIKGVLAADRLAKRLPNLSETFFLDCMEWNQIIKAPEVKTLISDHMIFDATILSDARLRATLTGSVFPIAYPAALELLRRNGLKELIASFRDEAIARTTYLGHSWSIWCSFLEAAELIVEDEDKKYCAERFAEFVSAELATPDGLKVYTRTPKPVSLVHFDADAIFEDVCRTPGFYGHSLITLSYLYQYRNTVDDTAWKEALMRMQLVANDPTTSHEVVVDIGAKQEPLEEGSDLLSDRLSEYLLNGPKEVHTLTLSDAILRLGDVCTGSQRSVLVNVVEAFVNWKVERGPDGERKKSQQ